MAPHHEVIIVDAEQHVGRGLIVVGLTTQLELGELGGEVVKVLPGLLWCTGKSEVLGAPSQQPALGEGQFGVVQANSPTGTRPKA